MPVAKMSPPAKAKERAASAAAISLLAAAASSSGAGSAHASSGVAGLKKKKSSSSEASGGAAGGHSGSSSFNQRLLNMHTSRNNNSVSDNNKVQVTQTLRNAIDVVDDVHDFAEELGKIAAGHILINNPKHQPILKQDKANEEHACEPRPSFTSSFAPPTSSRPPTHDVICAKHNNKHTYGHFNACCPHQNETLWKRELDRSRSEALEMAALYRRLQLKCALHVARRIARRRVRVSWDEWSYRTKLKRRFRRCMISIHGARMARSLRFWLWHTKRISRVKRLAKRMMNAKVYSAFLSWVTSAEDERRRRATARRVILRLLNVKMARAYAAWYEALVNARRLRRSGERAVVRMMRIREYSAFRRWKTAREDRVNAQRMGRYAVTKLLKRKLAIAFAGFVDGVTHQKHLKLVGIRVIKRITQARLASAWEAWAFRMRELARLQTLSYKAVEFFQGGCLRRAFAKWCYEADPETKLREKNERLRRRREVKRAFKRCAEQEHLLSQMASEVTTMREQMRKDLARLEVPLHARYIPSAFSPAVRTSGGDENRPVPKP